MTSTTFAEVSEGVRRTLAAYAHALDDGRTDDVVATFCADGGIDMGALGSFAGHEELREAYAGWEPRVPQRHLVVNTHVTEWDEHEAEAVSDVVVMFLGQDGWKTQVVGRYRDVLHHEHGAWRFHHRRAELIVTP
jgi:3-phenylpropionate/cinnamic acid dioxygenase small subunit